MRWIKIREIREKLRTETLDVSACLQSFCDKPSRKGIFKIQKAIDMLKEDSWVCIPLRSCRIGSATHPALAEAKRRRACRTHPVTGGATALFPSVGLGRRPTGRGRPTHSFRTVRRKCPAPGLNDRCSACTARGAKRRVRDAGRYVGWKVLSPETLV